MNVSSIATFFARSTRGKNDATNKIRDSLLEILSSPPKEYLEDAEFGEKWRIVQEAWNSALQTVATLTGIPAYTSVQVKKKAGRSYNYDADCHYYQDSNLVASRKLEFKFHTGGTKIDHLPQFIQVSEKSSKYISESYAKFYYENYLDKYIACDPEITAIKPHLDLYLKKVGATDCSVHPLFAQMKERKFVAIDNKKNVVHTSITDYLTTFGHTIDILKFSGKLKSSQKDKYYLIWCPNAKKFSLDFISEDAMENIYFDSIYNGNSIVLRSGSVTYHLLLRWKNTHGILNPAWQINVKRDQSALSTSLLPSIASIVRAEEPIVGAEEPIVGVEEPLVGVEEPLVGVEEPIVGAEEPLVGAEEPLVGAEEPLVGAEEPIIGAEEPLVGAEEPIIGAEEPPVGAEEPIVGAEEPIVGAEEPIVGAEESKNC